MDLNYSSEDRAFRDSTRRWLEANVPSEDLKTLAERKAWHRKLYEAGYVGMLWPKEYGGWGATAMQQAIVQDEMARIQAPPAINGLGISLPAHHHRARYGGAEAALSQEDAIMAEESGASSTPSPTPARTWPVSRRARKTPVIIFL
jgi:alkylation response protein AidB-like acyl-CoA dehydrogenase